MNAIRLIVVAALFACWTGAAAQKVFITAPSTLETYARDEEYISVVNEGIQGMKGTLTLVLDGGREPIPLGTITVKKDTGVRHQLTLPDNDILRANLLQPRNLLEGKDYVFRGHVQLVSTGSKTGTEGKATPVSFVSTIPITLYSLSHLLIFRWWGFLIWFPPLATIALLTRAWVRAGRPRMKQEVKVQQLLPEGNWVTNFSLFGALAASAASLIALDAPNKVTVGVVGAFCVALLAVAPLLYTLGQYPTSQRQTPGPTFEGTFDLDARTINFRQNSETKNAPGKASSVRWYLRNFALIQYAASLAMTLAFLVIPRTIDVFRSADIARATIIALVLQVVLVVLSLVSATISSRVVETSLRTSHEQPAHHPT